MEEINPFTITDKTTPSYETEVAKWFLIAKKRFKRCSVWLWISKRNKDDMAYVIIDNKTNLVVYDDTLLENILVKADVHDKASFYKTRRKK